MYAILLLVKTWWVSNPLCLSAFRGWLRCIRNWGVSYQIRYFTTAIRLFLAIFNTQISIDFLKSIFILCIIGYLLLLLLSNVNETQLIAILIPVCYSFDPYVLELVSSFFYVYTDIDQTDFHRSEPISCVDLYYVNTIFLVSFTLLSSYKTTSRCLIFNYVF